ncbi:MAG: hypothetical protein EXR48_00575 [Dehalococcoidia bacterium]|nr:hypothetical protein [Dehalococcoidia bacterium]
MTASNSPGKELINKRIAELADWRGQMFARLRKLILAAAPDITEEWRRPMAGRSSPTTKSAKRELVITRVFNAPREFAWKAWTVALCLTGSRGGQ